MADIKEIDYDQIVAKASQIAATANSMQNNIKEAFSLIDSMRDHWFGNSYDNFLNVVNLSTINLNKLFETTVSDIPHEIAAKAKSYAASNQASLSSSLTEQTAIILNEITKTNKGAKLRFKSSEISNDQKAIKAKFDAAKEDAENAHQQCEALQAHWNSISGDTNIRELKNAFTKVKVIIGTISNSLDSQISAQATTINALETAAGAVEAVKNVAENATDTVVDAATNTIHAIQQSASDVWKNLTGGN